MDDNYLNELRKQLPRGSRKILSSRTGKSPNTIDHVLHGRRKNPEILTAAINLMNEVVERDELLKQQAISAVEKATNQDL